MQTKVKMEKEQLQESAVMIFIAATCTLMCLQQAHTCLHMPLPHHTPIHAYTCPSLTTPLYHGMHYARGRPS